MKTIAFKLNAIVIALFVITTGCNTDGICERGKGTRVTQEIALPPLTGIDFQISGKVYLTQGPEQKVEVIGQENIIPLLSLEVNNDGIWEIFFEQCVRKTADFDLYITLPTLEYVSLSGSGDIVGQSSFDVNRLEIRLPGSGNIAFDLQGKEVFTSLPGSGNIELNLDTEYLDSGISGSGDLVYTGEATLHKSSISGSGDIKAFELITENTYVSISGSGSADVFVSNYLNVVISGSGNVSYKGFPAIDVTISGSGNVINAN